MTPIHYGSVENGKLTVRNKDRFNTWLATLKGNVELIVRKTKSQRSGQQNRFYWAYLEIIAAETGHGPNELHEYFKRRHLPPRFAKILGHDIKLPATTTELNKAEFSAYIMGIEAETGVPAPATESYEIGD